MCLMVLGSIAQVQRKMPVHSDAAVQVKNEPLEAADNGAPQNAKNREMLSSLNLSKEQRQKLKKMHQGTKEKKAAIENDTSLTEDQKGEQLNELHKAAVAKLKAILSEEQWSKMKEMRNEKINGQNLQVDSKP